jgi:hypothetical protein
MRERIANGELSVNTVTMQEIAIRITFIEKEFTYRFYSFKDFFGDIGGVFGAIKLSIADSFGGWIILFFIVDLIYMIISKHNFEYRISTIRALSPKCEMYGEHIIKLKDLNIDDEEKMRELEDDAYQLKLAKATINHQDIDNMDDMGSFDDDSESDSDESEEEEEKK